MNKRTLGALVAAIASTATAAPPVETCAIDPPAYRFLRFEEDNRYPRDPACRTDPWDDYKYIPLDDTGERFLTIGGDVRIRFSNTRNSPYGGPDPANTFDDTSQRYHLHVDFQAASWLRIFTELKSATVAGRNSPQVPPFAFDDNLIDTHQLFADLSWGGATLRIGRQELLYGGSRRIFPRFGANNRGSYDALRLFSRIGGWRTDAFVFRTAEADDGPFDDSTADNETFWGIYATGEPAALWPLALDLYWISAHRERIDYHQGRGVENRHSFGARLAGAKGRWDFDGEATVQVGQWAGRGSGQILAWALTADTGYTFPTPRPVRASVRLSAASGDRDRNNGNLETFYSILPYGGAIDDNYNLAAGNLLFARLQAQLFWNPQWRFRADVAWIGRTSLRDGLYGVITNPITFRAAGLPVLPSSHRSVGHDVGLGAVWIASRHLSFNVNGSMYFPGAYLRDVRPLNPDAWGLNVTMNYRF